tara:strand:+ start:897 stop:1073 length:177 start_codon:yes stop_codon:yes gene_type:complete
MLEIVLAYILGTIVGLWLTHKYRSGVVDSTIEALIEQHFIKTRIDQDGNTEIIRWNEN